MRNKISNLNDNPNEPASRWTELKKVIRDAACEAIPQMKKEPMSPKTKRAFSKLQKKLYRQKRFADVEWCKKEVALARSNLDSVKREHTWKKWRQFFANIDQVDPPQRVKRTWEFLKQYKAIAKRKPRANCVNQFDWLQSVCDSVVENHSLPMLPENDEEIPAPSLQDIKSILQRFKNGTTPGSDEINVELLKNAPDEFLEELQKIIQEIWISNKAPSDLTDTIQIPIPKKSFPKEVGDFRKITLCNVIYKIIASYILHRLDESIEEIPSYQAAFLSNRSVEDHIFTAKRVMEEYWNDGLDLYVFSLDIKQAFDSVSQPALIEALRFMKVHNFLINRIINLGLTEKTCLRWMNQKTPKVSKYYIL